MLADELLRTVRSATPARFERLVVDLLVAMGYGEGRPVGRTRDGGIDGIVNEDRLGLETIYIQAKRWESGVGRPDVQAFVGSLAGHHAKKGVFITTSHFSNDAEEYVKHIEQKVVLINGERLAQLMVDSNVGVADDTPFIVKRIDHDYFDEEE